MVCCSLYPQFLREGTAQLETGIWQPDGLFFKDLCIFWETQSLELASPACCAAQQDPHAVGGATPANAATLSWSIPGTS